MNSSLLHIFDKSACLTKRQMKDYVNASMMPEECHAAEVHLSSCPFCSHAIEGLQEHTHGVEVMATVDADFLKEHFSISHPEVHLNSLAPTASITAHPPTAPLRRGKFKTQPFRHTTAVAATILLTLGVIWYMKFGNTLTNTVVSGTPVVAASSQPEQKPTTREVNTGLQKSDASVLALASPSPASSASAPATPSDKANGQPEQQPEEDKEQRLQPLLFTEAASKADEVVASKKGVTENKAEIKKEQEDKSALATSLVAKPKAQESNTADNKEEVPERTAMAAAPADAQSVDELYEQGRYNAALAGYRKMIGNSDKRSSQQATLMAARCQLKLGKKAEAIRMLEQLASESGPAKREAKRMLQDMEKE